MAKRTAVGIDLGTTYSCISVFRHGKIEIITNDQGNSTTPSFVAFTNTEHLVGDEAKIQTVMNLDNTVFEVNKLIGIKFDDHQVQDNMSYWPFNVINENSKPKFQVCYKGGVKSFSPEEISSMVLMKMKETAEAYLGTTVTDVVITVPAYFNDSQRQAIKDTGTISGLNVRCTIDKPTAAVFAYGLDKKIGKHKVLIFDLGGGNTFEVSIVIIENDTLEVKPMSINFGGRDFDNIMVNHFIQEFKCKYNKDPTNNKRAFFNLKFACERVKQDLSSSVQASIAIDSLLEGIDFHSSITRARFEELCADLFLCNLEMVEKALNDAKIDKAQIDDIVLVGGCTRIPKIQNLLQDFFNGKELNKSIPPDEVAAYGAAVLANNLYGDISKAVRSLIPLHDVTPLSLGIEKTGGEFAVIINRNTTIPTKQIRHFTTNEDNQTVALIRIYQGERAFVKDNQLLGEITLTGIPPAPRGVQNIDVTFNIEANGILTVYVVETSTGKFETLTITNDDNEVSLTKEEIKHMIQDAETFKVKDRKQRVRIAVVSFLHDFYQPNLNMKNSRNFVSEEVLNKIAEVCNKTLEWLDDDHLAMKEALTQEIKQELGTIVSIRHNFLNENHLAER